MRQCDFSWLFLLFMGGGSRFRKSVAIRLVRHIHNCADNRAASFLWGIEPSSRLGASHCSCARVTAAFMSDRSDRFLRRVSQTSHSKGAAMWYAFHKCIPVIIFHFTRWSSKLLLTKVISWLFQTYVTTLACSFHSNHRGTMRETNRGPTCRLYTL